VRIDDERDLHERLDRAFETITPRPAPVDGTIRRGKAIKGRRRVAASVAVAAAVAVGVITVPSLHRLAGPAPAPGSGHYTVTVQPPGPGSPSGLIASGTINGKYWQLVTGKPGTGGAIPGNQEIHLSGPALENAMTGIVPDLSTDHPGPVAFAEVGLMPVEAQYGPVQADVSYVKVTLDNGTVLTLHPVTAYGARVVAFATPANAMIVSATAYSHHGEIATAIPFNEPGGQAFFGIWLKPGQHGIARASGSIGSGTAGGNTWSAFAYLGPWGVCVVSVTGPICAATSASDLGTEVMASTESSTPEVVTGVASPSVVRIVVHQPDGTVTQVRPVTIGGQKFFAFSETKGAQGFSWTAYDSSGVVVRSSPGWIVAAGG
jgi:hypothetical protein